MKTIGNKQLRTIRFALNRLLHPKAFIHLREYIKVDNPLSRRLDLGNSQERYLSEVGVQHLRCIFDAFHRLDLFDGQAGYSDVAKAVRAVVADIVAKRQAVPDAAEFIDLVRRSVESQIDTHIFAVPIYGVELEANDTLKLGSFTLTRSPVEHVQRSKVSHSGDILAKTVEAMKGCNWLIGSTRGTARVGLDVFCMRAELIAGAIAILAAATFEGGASAFRIGVVMSPEQALGGNGWFSWTERSLQLNVHRKFYSKQEFVIDAATLQRLREENQFDNFFAIFDSPNRTLLEDAITTAVYWFSDAHRDPVPTMQLVKYWSCVETFFSYDNNRITESLSSGLATVLTIGGYSPREQSQYAELKRSIAHLYGLRSRAVHRGSFEHVSRSDVARLSQWASWMLITVVAFAEQGCTDPKEIKDASTKLEAQLASAAA